MIRPPMIERRASPRIALKGSVQVRTRDHTLHGRISNIGAGGVLAATGVTAAQRLLRRDVSIDVRLDGPAAAWHEIGATVARITANALALELHEPPASFTRMMLDMAAESHADRKRWSVVLVDEQAERRALIASAFMSTGCAVVEAATPLEAIVRLGESSFEPDLIAIADTASAAVADELRAFASRAHPRARMVSISDELADPTRLVHWLPGLVPAEELAERIRSILRSPTRRTAR